MLRTLMQHEVTTNQALTPPHGRPRAPAAALRNAQAQEVTLLLAAQRASSAAPGGPMACSASREAEAGRVSASRAGGHAPRTGERVARKSASRACFCVTLELSWRTRVILRSLQKRKKTDNPREGWEDGTPPHRDFKERGVMR